MFKRVERQWGSYLELFRCKWLCIKILTIRGKLSRQRHKHRSELWISLFGQGGHYFVFGIKLIKWHLVRPMEWHEFTAWRGTWRVLEIQYGSDVRETDIERV